MNEQTPGTSIANVSIDVINEIKTIQEKHALSNLIDMEHIQKSFTIAAGIGQLSKLLLANDSVVNCLKYLQGRKLGFRTDKIYEDKVLVDVTVEALLRGLQLTGNQFNIIAGNLYIPKEGFEYLIATLDGMTDFFIDWGDYKKDGKVCKVEFVATWKYKGVKAEMRGFVPVRANDGMIVDAIYGKAERKVMARVYKKVTNSEAYFEEHDASDINTTVAQNTTATVKLAKTE